MNSITIITIVVVAILTVIIFGLTWLAYSSCIKAYRLEVNQGKHDEDIYKEYKSKKKKKNKLALFSLICSYTLLTALLSLFTLGIVYKARGENLELNNQTVLVIKSGSMSAFYDEEIASYYNNDTSLQFDVGDICVFSRVSSEDELVEGEVYGYKDKNNNIITHRLKSILDNGYEFRGDNNPISDYEYTKKLVQREDIIYHYTAKKVPAIGSFILFAQSYFGLWSLLGIIGVSVSAEVVYYKIEKINKERSKKLW